MDKHKIIFVIVVSLLLVSCTKEKEPGTIIKQKVTLGTKDNIKISGNFYPKETNKGIILLHAYKEDKNAWNFFIDQLRKEGYNVLAIDLRGHGESELDLKTMNAQDYNNMILDVQAAFDYLIEKNIQEVSLIGASIGANIALNFAVGEEGIQRIILLSPGLDYHGIKTEDYITHYKRPLLIIVGGLDKYSWESSNALFDKSGSTIKLQPYETDKHGIEILKQYPETKDLIINWMKIN